MRIPSLPAPFVPSSAVVTVHDPHIGPTYWGQNFNDDVRVELSPQASPDPIRASQFSEVGRPPTLAWADVPVALHMNIGGIQAVQEDTFLAGKVLPQFMTFLRNGNGGQLSFLPAKTIERGPSSPYGDRVTVPNAPPTDYPGTVSAHGLTYVPGYGY